MREDNYLGVISFNDERIADLLKDYSNVKVECQ